MSERELLVTETRSVPSNPSAFAACRRATIPPSSVPNLVYDGFYIFFAGNFFACNFFAGNFLAGGDPQPSR
jgi:hypothetical protein